MCVWVCVFECVCVREMTVYMTVCYLMYWNVNT